jgi:hypothetical protein
LANAIALQASNLGFEQIVVSGYDVDTSSHKHFMLSSYLLSTDLLSVPTGSSGQYDSPVLSNVSSGDWESKALQTMPDSSLVAVGHDSSGQVVLTHFTTVSGNSIDLIPGYPGSVGLFSLNLPGVTGAGAAFDPLGRLLVAGSSSGFSWAAIWP